jgi:hypothetical protein
MIYKEMILLRLERVLVEITKVKVLFLLDFKLDWIYKVTTLLLLVM